MICSICLGSHLLDVEVIHCHFINVLRQLNVADVYHLNSLVTSSFLLIDFLKITVILLTYHNDSIMKLT